MHSYEEFAVAYARHTAANSYNTRYERPAMHAELGDIHGKAVLDAACASGEHTKLLLEAGAARVIAVDASQALVDIARSRFDNRVQVVCADLTAPMTFAREASFDVVFSSLTLHYFERWEPTLREFFRVLVPGGLLLFSTHHPAMTGPRVQNYHATQLVVNTWKVDGNETEVRFYHRPLQAILDLVIGAGFRIERVVEPRLTTQASDVDDQTFATLSTKPWFLIVRAEKPQQ
jgi:SAM-dependent methyltransferase